MLAGIVTDFCSSKFKIRKRLFQRGTSESRCDKRFGDKLQVKGILSRQPPVFQTHSL